jgi:hypothetical protein
MRVYVLLCCSCEHITQNTALLPNFTVLSAYYTIACTAALPGSLARQLRLLNIKSLITGRPAVGRQNCKLFYGRHAALHIFRPAA